MKLETSSLKTLNLLLFFKDNSSNFTEVKAEQGIVVCEKSYNVPITLCTPRLVADSLNPAHIEQRSRDSSVIVLGVLCGVVVVVLGVVGCVAFRLRLRQMVGGMPVFVFFKTQVCRFPAIISLTNFLAFKFSKYLTFPSLSI